MSQHLRDQLQKEAEEEGITFSELARDKLSVGLVQPGRIREFLEAFVDEFKENYGVRVRCELVAHLALNCYVAYCDAYYRIFGQTPERLMRLLLFKKETGEVITGNEHFETVLDIFMEELLEEKNSVKNEMIAPDLDVDNLDIWNEGDNDDSST